MDDLECGVAIMRDGWMDGWFFGDLDGCCGVIWWDGVGWDGM